MFLGTIGRRHFEQRKINQGIPGGNVARGFHSFYNQITDWMRLLIYFKGGPGVGNNIYAQNRRNPAERGYDLECHCCRITLT